MYSINLYQQAHPLYELKLPLRELLSGYVGKHLEQFNAGQVLTTLLMPGNFSWSVELCRKFKKAVDRISPEECPPEYNLQEIKLQGCIASKKDGSCR